MTSLLRAPAWWRIWTRPTRATFDTLDPEVRFRLIRWVFDLPTLVLSLIIPLMWVHLYVNATDGTMTYALWTDIVEGAANGAGGSGVLIFPLAIAFIIDVVVIVGMVLFVPVGVFVAFLTISYISYLIARALGGEGKHYHHHHLSSYVVPPGLLLSLFLLTLSYRLAFAYPEDPPVIVGIGVLLMLFITGLCLLYQHILQTLTIRYVHSLGLFKAALSVLLPYIIVPAILIVVGFVI